MRGTKSNLIIKQGAEENYEPVLYIETTQKPDLEAALQKALDNEVAQKFPGTTMEKVSDTQFKINIPEKFKVGHEAHFGQVTENYLEYLEAGKLPDWEVPNMISKYYTTIGAYKMAKEK